MTSFCIEFGPEDDYGVIIHKLSCAHLDHASLLGAGRLTSLGKFATSSIALKSARIRNPIATCCPNCCVSESHANVIAIHGDTDSKRAGTISLTSKDYSRIY